MQGLETASLNQDWTVVGTPSDTTFSIAKSEHSITLTDLKTEAGTATVHFVLDISRVVITGNVGGEHDTVATVFYTPISGSLRLVRGCVVDLSGLTDASATKLNRAWTVVSVDAASSSFTFSPVEGHLLSAPEDGAYSAGSIRVKYFFIA